MKTLGIFVVGFFATFSTNALAVAPDPSFTPGVTCSQSDPDFDGLAYPEKIPHCNRNFGVGKKRIVAQEYGVPENEWSNYEFDHLIPLCAGGSNDIRNVWPEPLDHAHEKDVIEDQVCAQMRSGRISQATAIETIMNWLESHGYFVEVMDQ